MILVTELAAQKLKEQFAEMGKPNASLRIRVIGGGCSGFQYDMSPEEGKKEEDIEIQDHGVSIVVDPESNAFLDNTTIDYIDSLQGSGFKLLNPNAKSSCGCGDSFGV